MKNLKKILIPLAVVVLVIIGAGVYKFKYLSDQSGYDVGGNKAKVEKQTQFGIFMVLEDQRAVQMEGDITNTALKDFNNLLKNYPNIELIKMKNVPGSSDDDTNLALSKKIHQKAIKIHLMDGAEIASGGVDFFLAGAERTKGKILKSVYMLGVEKATNRRSTIQLGTNSTYSILDYYEAIGMSKKTGRRFLLFHHQLRSLQWYPLDDGSRDREIMV